MQPIKHKTYFEYKPSKLPFVSFEPGGPQLLSSVVEHDSTDDEEILETIFAACNHGSGQESKEFIKSNLRSMSVGDQVTLGNSLEESRTYECAGIGWNKL